MRKSLLRALNAVLLAALLSGVAWGQNAPLVLERDGRVISLEPYAPNILRVTIGLDAAAAKAAPGYGFVAKPSAEGWTHERDAEGEDVFRSARMVVRISPENLPADKLPQRFPLDALNQKLRDIYFGDGSGHRPPNDSLQVTTAEGKNLLYMRGWTMAPESQEVAEADAGPKGHRIAAVFDSPADEHYYGLGQQQKGWMDLRDHEIHCWHDYGAIGGEDVCVPFMVSSRGYGLVWDNPSKTTVKLGFNGQNVWSSEVGDRVSYFIIAGQTSDEIYGGYRLLTGVTHMLPRAVYGYIQSKAIYPTQQQALDVAKGVSREKTPAGCGGGGLPEHDEAGRT